MSLRGLFKKVAQYTVGDSRLIAPSIMEAGVARSEGQSLSAWVACIGSQFWVEVPINSTNGGLGKVSPFEI